MNNDFLDWFPRKSYHKVSDDLENSAGVINHHPLKDSAKLLLRFMEERQSYRFETTQGEIRI